MAPVLVEVPDDEEQPRGALHPAESQVGEGHDGVVEELLRQSRHQHEEDHVQQLRAGHQEVGRDALGEEEPEQAAEGGAGIEDRPERLLRGATVGQSSHLQGLQQGLAHGREDVAQGDDHVDAQADPPHEGLPGLLNLSRVAMRICIR